MNQENKVVKISDVIQNQIPEFILSENPNFSEFLEQYYVSQEFQGSSIDIAENLISYKNLDSFDITNLISSTILSSDVEFFDDVINVDSTSGWPKEYGLLKIDNEIITYTGITSTSFTGCIRGFSGTSSLTEENNPEFLVFSQTESSEHSSGTTVKNLSNLFLKEFFTKIKYQFTPGFEEVEFSPKINPQNFISKSKTFYQTKGTEECFEILFKLLYDEDVKIIKPDDYCFTPSDDKWRVVETFVCELVSGNPLLLKGQTLYQNSFPEYNIENANGSIYSVEKFNTNNNLLYTLQIFSGYSNNLNPKGSIEGTFSSTPNTYVVEDIISGSNYITVDSTVGFGNSGKLEINGLVITYTDKTNNQFLNCSGISNSIQQKSKVFFDHYVYAYEENSSNVVKFKLHNVLSKLESSNVLYSYDGDPIQIDHLGSTESSIFLNSLIYNVPSSIYCGLAVSNLTSQIRSNQSEGFSILNGNALCKVPHYLNPGDKVDLYVKNSNAKILENLPVNILSKNEFAVSTSGIQNSLLNKGIVFKRKVKKSLYQNLNLTANIQDSYVNSDHTYLTSNGLPDYEIVPLTFDKQFNSIDQYTFNCNGQHYFNSGEEVSIVSYASIGNFKNNIGIKTGNSYFIKEIGEFKNQISICESRANVAISSYIPLIEYDGFGNESGKVSSITVIPTSQYNRNFESSKLFKKFTKSLEISKTKEETQPGNIGVFVNGIELKNYKSFSKIYYGPIESVDVLNFGSGYDLLNPPRFKVEYENQEYSDTKIIPQLKGRLVSLSVTDPGFDYVEVPSVKILGGNNSTTVVGVKMKKVIHQVEFNATTKDTIIDTINNTFTFKSKHRFITGEPVIYKTNNTNPIGIGTDVSGGYLLNNSIYYVSNIGAGTSMSLAYNKDDAFSGTNLINLRTFGGGFQSFTSTVSKQGIDEVTIIQNDKDFEYKKISFIDLDVNTQDDIITVENHGFSTGDEVLYDWSVVPGFSFSGSSIQGLVRYQYYYIVKIDENRFKLSSTKNEINYVNFISTKSTGINYLEYSPIRVEISGSTTINGLSDIGYSATIVPIVRGTVVGANIQRNPNITLNTGKLLIDKFGYKNIINYEKYPDLKIIEGEGASFEPIIIDGKILKVIVKNSGSQYFNSFDLVVDGDGFGASLQAIVSNGSITDVKVVNGGVLYNSSNTFIKIVPVGTNAKLKANLTSWTVNQVTKNVDIEDIEDGAIFGKNYSYYGNTYGVYFLNTKLKNLLGIENSPTKHSPIVGWSYDGCPIYGPFAYANANGSGGIVKMRSGYSYKGTLGSQLKCVEEYVFESLGTLDKYNGRFCVTPEYPNGVYAYFCTFDENNVPEFPYVIGPQYNCVPIEENFNLKNNQSLNFNDLNIVKYTSPYRVEDKSYKYEYFDFSNSDKDIIVESSSTGFVDEIEILDGGLNYKVNDSIIFNNDGTSGFGAIAKVSEISGVEISTITSQSTSLSQITFVSDGNVVTGIASTYHLLKNNAFVKITGISTNSFEEVEGFRKIKVVPLNINLTSGISSSLTTGIVTSIKVNLPVKSFNVDTYLKINSEIIKVIGVDIKNNLLNILRSPSGPSYSIGQTITSLPNTFTFSAKNFENSYYELNTSYYFTPANSVSLGTSTTPGIGNTLQIYPLGDGIPYIKYVFTGGIYLPNNNFKTGDKVIYSYEGSTVETNYGNLDSFSNLYIIKLDPDVVGIVTDKSHISSPDKVLTYTSSGLGALHKFTTDRNIITGSIISSECNVSTASSHGLSEGDLIRLNVLSGITTTFTVTYSNNRVLINSEINPKIDVFANDKVIFDISSPSLSGKEFNLYLDENFLNPYVGNFVNGVEIVKTISQLILTISDNTPKTLFYNLSDTITDMTVSNYNKLIINDSAYNTESIVTPIDNYTFKFNLNTISERTSYTTPSILSYNVLSEGPVGEISKVQILSKGSNYKKLPQIISILSENGTGGNLIPNSISIGKINSTKVNNDRFICPSDKTLKLKSNIFSVLKLKDNYTVDSLNITSGGKNYITEPKIKLYNSKEDKIVEDFSASAKLKNNSINEITILNSGSGLKSDDNKIVVTNNTNGFKIINVSVSGTSPYLITLTIKTPIAGFSTSNPLPISVGDEIYVEGISYVGNGFNSSDYGYNPFTVTFVNPAYGSQDAAVVRYELTSDPGSYNSAETYNASVIPYTYIPKIESILKQSVFYNKETVKNTKIIDNDKNSPILNLLKVKESKDFVKGEIVSGNSSKSKGKVVKIENFNSNFTSDYSVSKILGGNENRGYLSSNIQKLSDNDYYQKFSYSLKSKKQYSDWQSIVSDTSHIAGCKKFSDLSIEIVGIGTTQSIKTDSGSTINLILDSYANINSIADYDLVNEIDLEDNNYEHTEYLRFNRLKLGNSIKSKDNRVLSIDDISSLFINESIVPKIDLDNVLSSSSTILKYEFYLTSSNSFLGELIYPETFELLVSRDSTNSYLTAYSHYFDSENLDANPFFGTFSVETNEENSNEFILKFTPKNPFISVDIKAIKETVPNTVGIATTTFGYVKNVEICQQYNGSGTEVFYSIPSSECKSGTIIIGISSSLNNVEKSFEASFVDTDQDILVNRYAENTLKELGAVDVSRNGSNIEFKYTGVGIGVTLQSNLKLLTNTYSGFDSITKTVLKLSSSKVTTNESSTGITTVSATYGYTKYVIEIEQNTGISTQRSIVQINSIHSGNYLNNTVYDFNGNIDINDLIFKTSYNIAQNNYTLSFDPVTSGTYNITIYESSLTSPN